MGDFSTSGSAGWIGCKRWMAKPKTRARGPAVLIAIFGAPAGSGSSPSGQNERLSPSATHARKESCKIASASLIPKHREAAVISRRQRGRRYPKPGTGKKSPARSTLDLRAGARGRQQTHSGACGDGIVVAAAAAAAACCSSTFSASVKGKQAKGIPGARRSFYKAGGSGRGWPAGSPERGEIRASAEAAAGFQLQYWPWGWRGGGAGKGGGPLPR